MNQKVSIFAVHGELLNQFQGVLVFQMNISLLLIDGGQ